MIAAESFIFLMISVAALSFKPGPGMAAIVTRSLRDGFWPAFCLSMGCTTIEMFYFLVAVFSFSIIISSISGLRGCEIIRSNLKLKPMANQAVKPL